MTRRKAWWLAGIFLFAIVAVMTVLFVIARNMIRSFQPMVHDEAVQYLRERFHCDVQLASLNVHLPKLSKLGLLLKHERGAVVRVDGAGLSMKLIGHADLPPLFAMRKFRFDVDLGTLTDKRKTVDQVVIDGLEINLPPKQERTSSPGNTPAPALSGGSTPNVLIKDVKISGATLTLLPKDPRKKPLLFDVSNLRLTSVGVGTPMKYDAMLSIPKPPGQVHSQGDFGPWEADDPNSTPLGGSYTFNNADLGIFNGIAGILNSKGRFDGTLGAVHATGECTVPDFRLKMAGNRVPLWAHFDALVDGTNGNTILQPVKAKLGSTVFTTSGAVVRHGEQSAHTIDLKVNMPNGYIRDLLRLTTRQPPFMEGRLNLQSTIAIPPLTAKVKDKLLLDGTFQVSDARFLKSSIQSQLDQLSRRGSGQPQNQEIDQVVSDMGGAFHLQNEMMTFSRLSFGVPGATVNLGGDYNMDRDTLNFHGTLKLVAKLSQTVTGWKHWALKPVDPFFEKNGAGTFLRIRVDGPTSHPHFGLDR